MKKLYQYINEKLIVNNTIKGYKYHPTSKNELIECIKEKIKKEGYGTKDNQLDLNDIDTSKITDMSDLFNAYKGDLITLSNNGQFDISNWDVSNVKNMSLMFLESNFNGDISDWDVSKVKNMEFMFFNSKFTGENGDIANWDVSNVENMSRMFWGSRFSGDLFDWNIINVKNVSDMFAYCPLEKNPPKWYKSS